MAKRQRGGRPVKPEAERAVRVSVSLRPQTFGLVKQAADEAERNVSQFVDLTLRAALGAKREVPKAAAA